MVYEHEDQHEFVTRGTSDPANIDAQIEDFEVLIVNLQRRLNSVKEIWQVAKAEVAGSGITQNTCETGVAKLKKLHNRLDSMVGRAWILHHCMQGLLPPGVSEGNKC